MKCYKVMGFKYAYYGGRKVLVLHSLKYCCVSSKFDLLVYLDILKREFKIDRFSIYRVWGRKIKSLGRWSD